MGCTFCATGQAGFDRHLIKPVDPEGLAGLVADWSKASAVAVTSA